MSNPNLHQFTLIKTKFIQFSSSMSSNDNSHSNFRLEKPKAIISIDAINKCEPILCAEKSVPSRFQIV